MRVIGGAIAAYRTDGMKERPQVEPLRAPGRRDVVGTERILLVEDKTVFRQSLALLLEWRTGLECISGGSIAEARRILDDGKDTLFVTIMDLDLPDARGLLERLRGLPVLALATEPGPECRARTLEAGADEVLSKAAAVEEILATVQRFLGDSQELN